VVAHVIGTTIPIAVAHERVSAAALAARRERDDSRWNERERAAAFRVQVELAHRVPVQPLGRRRPARGGLLPAQHLRVHPEHSVNAAPFVDSASGEVANA